MTPRKRSVVHKMTKWEAYNILPGLTDRIAEYERELNENGFFGLANELHKIRMHLGREFNLAGTDVFGLAETSSCGCPCCLKRRKG